MALKLGAKSFSMKPLSNNSLSELISGIIQFNEQTRKKILVIEDSESELQLLSDLLANDSIEVFTANTAKKGLAYLKKEMFDCIIVDFVLPDANGLDLLNRIDMLKQPQTTIILHSARDFTQNELIQLKRLNHKIITKTSDSHAYLLEEILTLFHIDKNFISESNMDMIDSIRPNIDVLDAKKVLVVDDDVRNLFALTAVFERSNIEVITAESGREALEILNSDKKIDIVLMDIMMPEMDGYETIQIIRKETKLKNLPIIAVTAKAMIGDRQKCIASGASDYITKPVKTDQLLSLMRVWLIK